MEKINKTNTIAVVAKTIEIAELIAELNGADLILYYLLILRVKKGDFRKDFDMYLIDLPIGKIQFESRDKAVFEYIKFIQLTDNDFEFVEKYL